MKNFKKFLALILSTAMLLTFLPVAPVVAETNTVNAYAESLGAVMGNVLLTETFNKGTVSGSTATEVSADITQKSGWQFIANGTNTSLAWKGANTAKYTVNSTNGLNFYCSNGDAVLLLPDLDTSNYIITAKIKRGGGIKTEAIAGFMVDVDGDGTTATKSQTFGLFYDAKNSPYTVSSAFFADRYKNYTNYELTQSLTLGDYVTLSLVSYEGNNYFFVEGVYVTSAEKLKTDDERIGFVVRTSDIWVDDITVTSLSVPVFKTHEEIVEEKALELGATIGDELLNEPFKGSGSTDVTGEIAGTAAPGWKFIKGSRKVNISNGAMNLYDYSSKGVALLPNLNTSNYILSFKFKGTVTSTAYLGGIITDTNDSASGTAKHFALRYVSGKVEETRTFGVNTSDSLVKTTPSKTYSVADYIDVSVISYEGMLYYYIAGDLISSVEKVKTADERIGFFAQNGDFYVDDVVVTKLVAPKTEDGLFADSGFITGDVIESIDFSKMNTGSITESGNWTFTKASVKKAPEGSSNALYFDNNSGSATANVNLSKKNFVAVAVFGTTSDTKADGYFSLGVIGLTKANAKDTALSTSFSQINRTNTPRNGQTMVVDGGYTYGSAVTFDEDGYTLVTVTMYAYDDVYYCYCDGMFLGTYVNRKGVSTDEVCELSVSNSWSYGYLHSVTVYDIVPADFTVSGASYVSGEKSGLNVALTLDQSKNNGLDMSGAEYGAVVTLKNGSTPENTTVETANAEIVKFNATNESVVKFNHFVEATDNQFVNVRPYILVNGTYYYSEAKIYSVKAISAVTKGENTKRITFTAFSDFHYMKNQETGVVCRSDVSDLVTILERAEQTGSAFVMHGGDFTKDAKVSSEIFETYHNYKKENGEIMPVYGIYGNHDLEQSNKMSYVNTTLTNDTVNTVWGTDSGKMEVDSRIAYYYADYDSFRFIYLDDMYSYNPTKDIWERNYDGSYSHPSGNTKGYSLGPVQMAWLKEVLTDAGKNDMTCVVTTHAAKHDKLASATGGDRAELLELYKTINNTYPSTVVLCLSGHTHGDEIVEADGIVWMDINNTFANLQSSESLVPETGMYSDDMTVRKEIYDNDGNFLRYEDVPLNTLQFKDGTYYAEDPLSAVITIDENGVILIDGTDSQWVYGIEPSKECLKGLGYLYGNARKPRISSYSNINCEVTGHIFVNSDECASCHKYIAKQTEGFDYDYIKIAESVVDNETYSVKIKYKSNADKAISCLTADNDIVFRNAGYIGTLGKEIITLKQSDTVIEAEAFITIDKFTSGGIAQGDALYLYLSDADGLEIENITLTKLSAEYGGALIKNKGVSILKDVAENEEQALRFYFSYETTDGTQLLINNKAYTVKSRGFLIANANTIGDKAVNRETAKQQGNKILDINVKENLNKCWQYEQNTETNYDIWYSVYIRGFKSINNTYNNKDKIYTKGYVVIVDEFGNEFVLYSKETSCTVKDIAILN